MSFGTAYGTMKRNKKRMAFGGEAAEEGQENESGAFGEQMSKLTSGEGFAKGGQVTTEDRALDLVGKIMAGRKSAGAVANEPSVVADELPNEFDDMVLRDEFSDDSGPGNEIGDEAQDERDSDVVGKIMASRKKKSRA